MDRQQAFQLLKRPCIQLLQTTASIGQTPGAKTELVQGLTNLLDTLQKINPKAVDAKLAEYAFVPISQVLRSSRQVPVRGLELCLECISRLLQTGWGGALEPALSGQLLILFTFLAKPSSAENGIAATSEELQALAFQCMAELLTENGRTQHGRQAITSTANVPALGEAVLVMVESLASSPSHSVRLQAVNALKAITGAIDDNDALASFFPKIVSSLTNLLTSSGSSRPNFRIVESGLNMLTSLLSRLLSDENTKRLPEKAPSTASGIVARSMSWLQATSSQIKLALSNIFKLREHDKPEVREALLRLCLCVIQDCRNSLSDCTSMAVETMVSLVGRDEYEDRIEQRLKALLAEDAELSGILRESLHGWIVSLSRIMQSKDDHRRRRMIQQVSVTLRLFDDSTNLDDRLADSLRDGVSIVLSDSKGLEEVSDQSSSGVTDRTLMLSTTKSLDFPSLKLRFKGQEDMMAEFKLLVHELARSDAALKVVQELTTSIDAGPQERRLASFWLSVNLLQDVTTTNPSIDDFMDLGTPNVREEVLDDLYSHSLTILNERDADAQTQWQFFALALETVALQSKRYRLEFRAELSEVLYPVLSHLGSSNPALREHAMTCLNIVSEACGYADAGDLVVQNVDYIVNAVGLKLAIGDVSPQAPQVLLMMMRLCGPSLLPYLDDLIGSIFDALERYHGYPKLAELLFSVLKAMTEEGVKAPQLALTTGNDIPQTQHKEKSVTMADAIEALKQLQTTLQKQVNEASHETHEPFPQKPWKQEKPVSTSPHESYDNDALPEDSETPTEPSAPTTQDDPPPPAPRTYTLLLKISSLTQHYLTTPSPSLRTSLLALLRTTIPTLARHENSFLPLIHTLWPVLIPRLEDPEAYIVANALDTVALMCEYAGDFMRTRIDDAWDILGRVYRRAKGKPGESSKIYKTPTGRKKIELAGITHGMGGLSMMSSSISSSGPAELYTPEHYIDAPTRMIWNAFVGLLCSVARFVTVKEERGDEMLDMLDSVLEREDVRSAMECWNADAVWLRLWKKGSQVEHVAKGVGVGEMPVGRPQWRFVAV
ncbi:similar to HEAT repeat protein [Plenodomus lingam JN3]|uniref:Similar to HEAT repeat protein n=1 Tax=Leptosphaeria maculans (strain JN3 / isolate v23.1.3 / race Av1-4-5-6-7-8) TaxID=985895 RepID=E5A0Y5_LEPMJ|nr:similar to HEAT repeat protein [Plenodomus lingam JN3]CBX97281.1 similar to HEAT repeat protein [Plenodomus lingam JN3]